MELSVSQLTDRECYQLLIGSVLPRPIAFVTSVGSNGVINAAPFSFFNVMAAEPPLLMLGIMRKNGGTQKDTARNILKQGEFVVHVVDERTVEKVNITALDAPPDLSEIDIAGFTLLSGHHVCVPRVKECKIAMECQLHTHYEVGKDGRITTDVIVGEVLAFHIDDAILHAGKIDIDLLQAVGRLAGNEYTKIQRDYQLVRPTFPYTPQYTSNEGGRGEV